MINHNLKKKESNKFQFSLLIVQGMEKLTKADVYIELALTQEVWAPTSST